MAQPAKEKKRESEQEKYEAINVSIHP